MPILVALWTTIIYPVLQWLLSTTVMKGITLFLLSFLFMFLLEMLWGLLPEYMQPSYITSALVTIPPSVWWVLDLFRFTFGLKLVLSALVIRFLIRRLPLIG
jgi:hypothetical protein